MDFLRRIANEKEDMKYSAKNHLLHRGMQNIHEYFTLLIKYRHTRKIPHIETATLSARITHNNLDKDGSLCEYK